MAHTFKILPPTAIPGYGFPKESFRRAMEESPDLVAVDVSSSDPGPHHLEAGEPFTDRAGMKRGLCYMIVAGVKNNIPVVVGAVDGSGAAPHLEWRRQIIHEIMQEERLSLPMALTPSDIDEEIVYQVLDNGKITMLDFMPELTHEAIEESTYIVTQMDIEPFQRVLKAGAQVILDGRTYDPTCLATLLIMQGFDEGLALHCDKILECAAITATPSSGPDRTMGAIDDNGFTLKAFNPKHKLAETSAAAHILYEKLDPCFLSGPDGVLNLKARTFTRVNEGEMYASDSRHEKTLYALKLEGVHQVGFRCLTIAEAHDPIMIVGIDTILKKAQASAARNLSLNDDNIRMTFHLYGRNGVMGNHEPVRAAGHELGILLDIVALTQNIANNVCLLMHSTLLYYSYENRIATTDNLASPFLPSDTQSGPVCEFSIHHLIEVGDTLRFDLHIERATPGGVQA